jgi:hypothetical protein
MIISAPIFILTYYPASPRMRLQHSMNLFHVIFVLRPCFDSHTFPYRIEKHTYCTS